MKSLNPLFLSALAMVLASTPALAQMPDDNPLLSMVQTMGMTKMYAPDAVIVSFRDDVPMAARESFLSEYGLSLDPNCPSDYFARLIIPNGRLKTSTIHEIVAELGQDPRVRYAELDPVIVPDQTLPNDPTFSNQYAMHNTGQSGGLVDADIDGPEGWSMVPNNAPPIIVAVADDQFQVGHNDLAANFWINEDEIPGNNIDDDANGFIDDDRGWDFSSNNRDVSGSGSHGMHCAGIVGMVHNNSIGGAGAAKNVRLMPLQITGGSLSFMSALVNAVDYARLNGAKVITVSYNIDGFTQALTDAIGRAKASDMVYVNSAGNNNQNMDNLRGQLQAIHDNVVFVASTDRNDNRSSFSNFGQRTQLAAPGSDIWSTLNNNTHGNNSGTSMAAPCAAGVIATVRQMFPNLTASQAIQRVRLTSEIRPWMTSIGGGRVNLALAIGGADEIPPSNPANLEICKRSSSGFKIRFNGSGDDGVTGQASTYEVRYSANPITVANFSTATLAAQIAGNVNHGALVEGTVTGFPPGVPVHMAVRSFDNLGNPSAAITSVGPVATVIPPYYDNSETARFSSTSWARTTVADGNGQVWTDSVGGNYADNANLVLLATQNIALGSNPILRWRGKMSLESTYDFLLAEVSTNGGTSWQRVFRFTGDALTWQEYSVSLAAFANQNVLLRFRLTTDVSVTRDGVYLDDFQVLNGTTLWSDDMEGASNFVSSPAGWARVNNLSFSPTQSWHESPTGNTPTSSTLDLRGTSVIDTRNLVSPIVSFAGYMALPRGYRAEAITSTDGTNWTPSAAFQGTENAWGQYASPIPSTNNLRVGVRVVSTTAAALDGFYVDDLRVIGETWENRISGNLGLNGYQGNIANRPLTLQLMQPGTNTVLAQLPLGATGIGSAQFNLLSATAGMVDIVIGGSGFLTKRWANIDLNACDPVLSGALVNGDINGDNEIGAADFSLLAAAYDTVSGDPGFSAAADLNGDGEVGAADFSILAGNYDAVGE